MSVERPASALLELLLQGFVFDPQKWHQTGEKVHFRRQGRLFSSFIMDWERAPVEMFFVEWTESDLESSCAMLLDYMFTLEKISLTAAFL